MLPRDRGDVVGVGREQQVLGERPPGSLVQLGDHPAEFAHRELNGLVLQRIAVPLVDVTGRRRIHPDLHPVRP